MLEDELQEMERLAETLWDACYDAMWMDWGYFRRFIDLWRLKRFYLTDEVSPAAEITAPTW